MTLRLLAAALVVVCLAFVEAAGAFFKLTLPADWPPQEQSEPACEAARRLATLDARLREAHVAVARLSAAAAADYLAAVKALFDVDLPAADLLVIVELLPADGGVPTDAVALVFGFNDGCRVFRVRVPAAAHRAVMDAVQKRHPAVGAGEEGAR